MHPIDPAISPRSDNQVPPLRLHQGTGQGYVLLNGRRKYLGRYDRTPTPQAYDRMIVEWLAGGREPPIDREPITIVEMIARFRQHAEAYDRRPDGSATSPCRASGVR